jgi:hypothetical protein
MLLGALLHVTAIVDTSLALKRLVFVGTEGQGFSVAQNEGLKFKISEIVAYTFHLNILAVVRTKK